MKNFIKALMGIQIILFIGGGYIAITENILMGITIMLFNLGFFLINIGNLKGL